MSQEKDWSLGLRATFEQALQEYFGSTWGYDAQENGAMVADIAAMLRMPSHHMLSITNSLVHAQGIELSMTVGGSIRSLSDLSKAVYDVLGAVGERLLVVLPIVDNVALRYWFVIGSKTHGHIGEIIIPRENMKHIDLPVQ